MLTTGMGAGVFTFCSLIGLDSFYLVLLFLLAILQSIAKSKSVRVLLWLALVFMSVIYLVDSLVLLAVDDHASLFDIGRYASETGVVLSFFNLPAFVVILLLLVSIFLRPAYSPAMKKFTFFMLMLTMLITGLGTAYAPQPLARYAMLSRSSLQQGFGPQKPDLSYSTEQIDFYTSLDQEVADIPSSRPDVILLIIESLSSINSKKNSGTAGFLDRFDTLAEDGVLFRNFFANHQASEGGLIALLGGYPPMHFPTASPYMFDEFAIQTSVIAEYQQQGYFTEFLTNSDLSFIGLNHYLDGLGLDRSRGRDEVETMRNAQRVVQNAPSDALLYSEALLTIRRLVSAYQPFLLTVATTSTHLPYTHPEDGPDTPEAVWDWSLQQLAKFYQQLSESGYFEAGILLITGDHRQMRPLTEVETARYGGSARARVPLLVIGKAYPGGTIDNRFFQQSDLLRMLGKIKLREARLSPQAIWVERYNRKYGRIELIDRLSVFDEADLGRYEYRLKVPGNKIEWLGKKPGFSRRVEARIHAQRSLHQRTRNDSKRQAGSATSADSE